jgi:hypothetical protein
MTVTQSSTEVHMHDDSNANSTPTRTEPAEPAQHHSTFAEGESHPDSHPEEEHVGTFAEGESHPDSHPEEEHVGTFAEGESHPDSHPEEEHVGAFAEGQETRPAVS